MLTRDLVKDEMIQEWSMRANIKDSTKRKYLEAMKPFLEMTAKTPRDLVLEAEEDIRQGKLKREWRAKTHFFNFKRLMLEKVEKNELSDATVTLRLYTVMSFYSAFDISLPKIANGNTLPQQKNMNPFFDKEHIRKMLIHCAGIRDKAIILTMKSSGMARKEIIDLTYKQFREGYNRDDKIATIYSRRSKVNLDFITFIDPEGTEAILDYLKWAKRVTKDGLFDSMFDSLPLFTINRNRTEEINEVSFIQVFWRLSMKMQMHEITPKPKTYTINPIRSHNLRKFFNTSLKNDGLNSDLVEFMMGHRGDRTKGAYYLYDAGKLKEQYMAHMHTLTINSNGTNTDMLKENKKLKAEIERIKTADSNADDAIMELLNDDAVVRKLFEKFKAMQNGSG